MAETSFALANNDEGWSATDPSYQSLRKKYPERVEAALKHAREMARYEGDSPMTTEDKEMASVAPWASTQGDSPMTTEDKDDAPQIIDFPDLSGISQTRPQVIFHALQEWEGYVLEHNEREFTARLLDLTADSMQEDEAIIPLVEISEDDLNRLRPGSIFRWVIGYERSASGTKKRVSQIVFRDLPAMTEKDLSEGEEWAKKIAQSITQ